MVVLIFIYLSFISDKPSWFTAGQETKTKCPSGVKNRFILIQRKMRLWVTVVCGETSKVISQYPAKCKVNIAEQISFTVHVCIRYCVSNPYKLFSQHPTDISWIAEYIRSVSVEKRHILVERTNKLRKSNFNVLELGFELISANRCAWTDYHDFFRTFRRTLNIHRVCIAWYRQID